MSFNQSSLSEGAVPLFNLEVMWESVFTGLDFDLILSPIFDQNLLHMMEKCREMLCCCSSHYRGMKSGSSEGVD